MIADIGNEFGATLRRCGVRYARKMNARGEDRRFWEQTVRYATDLGLAIRSHVREASPTTRALDPFNGRITCALDTLTALDRFAKHDSRPDGMTVLRAMYDAHLQALYILDDPAKADQRAELFLDFQWIEQRRKQEIIEHNPTRFAERLRQSPKREEGREEREANYERLRPQYLNRDGSRVRSNWYPGTLRDLARAVKLESEYELLQNDLSGAVHSSPRVLLAGPSFGSSEQLLLVGWKLNFRVLGRIAAHHRVPLDERLHDIVQDAMSNLFDFDPGSPHGGPAGGGASP